MENNSTRQIPLTKGYVALVDAADYEMLNAYSWHAALMNGGVYARRTDNTIKRVFYIHRQLLGLKHGDKRQGDHKNGDTLDCRRENLRIATPSQNKSNSRRLCRGASGFRGVERRVSPRGNISYRAVIEAEGRQRHLGTYAFPEQAARSYDNAAREVFGEFARLNFPTETI